MLNQRARAWRIMSAVSGVGARSRGGAVRAARKAVGGERAVRALAVKVVRHMSLEVMSHFSPGETTSLPGT